MLSLDTRLTSGNWNQMVWRGRSECA